jgi:formamidopyrimidine-DNA glycosylase
MIEIAEGIVLASQLNQELKGKRIETVIANSTPHGFAWYHDNPADYGERFHGRTVEGAYSCGGKVYLKVSDNHEFMFCEGINIKYYTEIAKVPKKHQLFIQFNDDTYLVCTIQMYGGIYGYQGRLDNIYDAIARSKPGLLSEEFDFEYFKELMQEMNKPRASVKEFLATQQRIPGLGNGTVQDVMLKAGLHPKHAIGTLTQNELKFLFQALKETVLAMMEQGGRDVETDIYGNPGGYRTLLSKVSYKKPCSYCGGEIIKDNFLGGTIYYCPSCQK